MVEASLILHQFCRNNCCMTARKPPKSIGSSFATPANLFARISSSSCIVCVTGMMRETRRSTSSTLSRSKVPSQLAWWKSLRNSRTSSCVNPTSLMTCCSLSNRSSSSRSKRYRSMCRNSAKSTSEECTAPETLRPIRGPSPSENEPQNEFEEGSLRCSTSRTSALVREERLFRGINSSITPAKSLRLMPWSPPKRWMRCW
mmetsp:Transcript_14170/g.33310  ORF Transcript_14170/g.33310 Transcript_14170/m.33310 type:complete len:201 (-) Transcript_14170:1109-1711(-)